MERIDMSLFGSIKDNLSSFSGEQLIRKAAERYGELRDFKINSSAKTMYIKILLKGEKEPIDIKVNKYTLIDEHGSTYVKVYDVEASREWISRLAEDYLIQQKFEVPDKYSSMVKKLL
jgi:sporulation protein YlmC with PRC-barrel domain